MTRSTATTLGGHPLALDRLVPDPGTVVAHAPLLDRFAAPANDEGEVA